MAFCLKGILLLVLAVTLQPLTGVPVKLLRSNQADTVNKARDIVETTASSQANFLKRPGQTKRNPSSTFKFLNQSELAKGIDYLKNKYPDVDWSLVTPLPTSSNSGKRAFEHKTSLEQTKRSSFGFLNQSEIAKGLDYLKKKYPDVDWSFVTPLPTLAGKREFEHRNSLTQAKRTSSFGFLNQSEIAKGLDYLKKKYPDVDWSFVTPLPTSSPGRREFKGQIMESGTSKTNSITNKRLDQQKKSLPIIDSSIQQRNDIPEKQHNSEGTSNQKARDDLTSSFEFLDPEEEVEGLEYLQEKHPQVDWSTLIEEDKTLDA